MYFTVTVTDQSGKPVGGATVLLTVIKPNGRASTVTAGTNSAGQAFFQYKVNVGAQLGTYIVSATASETGFNSATATGSFVVT